MMKKKIYLTPLKNAYTNHKNHFTKGKKYVCLENNNGDMRYYTDNNLEMEYSLTNDFYMKEVKIDIILRGELQ